MIVNRTIEILKESNLFAKKMYGQNFITSSSVLENIIQISAITKDVNVIEIGPGLGALSEFLATNANKVLAYEIDKNMVNILKDTLAAQTNIKVINQDFLKANLTEDIKAYFNDSKTIKVVANIPYYITTPIIFKLLEDDNIEEMCFMVQKELAKRLAAKPNTKDYNALSVIINYKAKAKIEANVSRNCFYPVPGVDSVLLSIKKRKSDYSLNNEANFLDFIGIIFAKRRKTLVNNIIDKYASNEDLKEKKDIEDKVIKLGYQKSVRAEELSLEEIVLLYKELFESE